VVCTPLDQCHNAGTCNVLTGLCSNPAKPDGASCDDGVACTIGDLCSAGVCAGTAGCGPCRTCDSSLGCVAAPATDCRKPTLPRKARLTVKDSTANERDAVTWKWGSGAETTKADFGNPTSSTDYTLCVYDRPSGQPRLRLEAVAPAGGACAGQPCWRETSTGYRYADRERTPDGLSKILLRAGGQGRARITLKGKGANLEPEAPPYVGSVTAQLRSEDGVCWDADYPTPSVNGPDRYDAMSD
jgi:hypothetical protein